MWRYAYPDDNERKDTKITRALVRRVLAYANPYRTRIVIVLILILVQSGLGLLTPLIVRDLLDHTLNAASIAADAAAAASRLDLLAIGLILIPIVSSVVGIIIRQLNSFVGEGVIYDLRVSLYSHLQRMSLRFFTNTKSGELMSRLNNDVINAQTAISDTIVGIVTNAVKLIATLAVMFALEWRLTLLGLIVFPLFIFSARAIGRKLRGIAREAMDNNAEMNAMIAETLNISGALLVKLFGRRDLEVDRFAQRAARVRDIGVKRAVTGSQFWALLGGATVIGTALVYWGGGHLVLGGTFTIGDLVAFSAYLGQLYSPMQYLVDVPVEFTTSMVSFERVFEIVDLPLDIEEKPDAIQLHDVQGALVFENVTFRYSTSDEGLLSDVRRHGRIENVRAVLSGDDKPAASSNGSKAQRRRRQRRQDASAPDRAGRRLFRHRAGAARRLGRTERRRQNDHDLPDPAPL